MKASIVYYKDAQIQDLGGGVSRRVFAYTPTLMTVAVSFEKGSVGALHSHPHCQNTYILSGRFRFTVDGKEVEVAEGDTLAFPANSIHGSLCLEAGTLLDTFTPMREDFIN